MTETLLALKEAGLTSLPGGGAEQSRESSAARAAASGPVGLETIVSRCLRLNLAGDGSGPAPTEHLELALAHLVR